MDKKNRIRTYPIKPLVIFLSISFTVSLAMVILFIFLKSEGWLIRILIFIFCGLFTIASAIVLVYQLVFYVAVDDDYFYRYAFLTPNKIPLKKIQRVFNKDGFYEIYVDNKKIASFAGNTKEGQQIIVFLERKGIHIDWWKNTTFFKWNKLKYFMYKKYWHK